MRRLARLRGAALKNSNEKLLNDYGNLAKFVVGKYVRAFQLSREQAEDLLHSILVELFKAPASYRNYKGVSLMLKHKMRDVIAKTVKCEVEMPAGLPGQFPSSIHRRRLEGDPFEAAYRDKFIPNPNDAIDSQLVLKHLDVLSSSERAVLGLLYGLDGNSVFSPTAVAKKLGKDEWWVHRKREKAVTRLRSALAA